MEVLNISVDENEEDTSCDELDEDPEFRSTISSSPLHKKYIHRESISRFGDFSHLFKEWERPAVPEGTLVYSSSSLEPQPEPFRFLFLDSVSSISKIKHPSILEGKYNEKEKKSPLYTVIRLFGVAQVPKYSASQDLFNEPDFMDPNSFEKDYSVPICCNVHGYYPYIYALPTVEIFESEHLCEFQEFIISELNKKVYKTVMEDIRMVHVHDFLEAGHKPVVAIEFYELDEMVTKIFHFPCLGRRNKKSLVLSVILSLPMFVPVTALELSQMQVSLDNISRPVEFDIFENNLNNNLRFLADQNIPGCTWLELKAGKYFHRTGDVEGLEPESHCQIELDVHYEDIFKMTDQPDRIPPLRVLSLDLESRVNTQKAKNGEGGYARNQIIQIGAVLATYNSLDGPIIGKSAFVLGTCDPLPDTVVIPFYDHINPNNCSEENLYKSEAAMLSAFRDFVIQVDPDIITGYNIKNFDLPYLIDRADRFCDKHEEAARFSYLGRLKKIKASVRKILNKNKRMYSFDHKIVNIQGRIVMDMYPLFNRHTLIREPLKLKDVAKKYLAEGEEKEDVKYTEINGLQNGNSRTRSRLAKYCVQDCYLPVKLMLVHMPDRKPAEKNFVQYYFELARLGGTIFRYLVNKSRDYNKYFKQVRVQKNDGEVQYYPDTPSPKKAPPSDSKDSLAAKGTSPKASPSTPKKPVPVSVAVKKRQKKASRMLFTEED